MVLKAPDFASASSMADDAIAPSAGQWADRSERLRTMLLAGRLVTADADHLCRVRNVSAGGMMVECDAVLTVGEPVRVELRNMSVAEARIAWIRRPQVGLQFTTTGDVDAIIHGSGELARMQPRAPRLSAACPVLIRHVGHTRTATLRDLSQSGCRVSAREPITIGTDVRIDVPGLAPHHATVRWARDGEIGLAFHELLSFAVLSTWQRDCARRFEVAGEKS